MRKLSAAVRARRKKTGAAVNPTAGSPKKKKPAAPSKKGLAAKAAVAPKGPAPAHPFQAVLRAASFAARKHQGQKRADAVTPYFSHVARVTLVLSHEFEVEDEDILTAALLHDTIEDTDTDYDEVAALFGERVAGYVVLLTKNPMLPKKEREEDYVVRLSRAPEAVMIAKMADMYDNLSDRVHSPKLGKTAATAGRLLEVFGQRLESSVGRAAHRKLSALLTEVQNLQLADALSGPAAASD